MTNNTTEAARPHLGRVARPRAAAIIVFASTLFASSGAFAQIGCQGQNATSDSGGRSVEVATQIQSETLNKAKASAGLSSTPVFGGVSANISRLKHDGYRLKTPVVQQDCTGTTIPPINELTPFKTRSHSFSGIGELDMTRSFGLPPSWLYKVGIAIGGKWTKTDYRGSLFTPADPASGGPTIGVNVGAGKLEESGVQIDTYSLIAAGSTYAILASSFGFGDTDVSNPTFFGLAFTSPDGTAAGAATTAVTTFGGGTGSTDYHDSTFSGTLGNVFVLSSHAGGRVLADLSGGLLYAKYTRDGFTDTTGVRFSDAKTKEFAGKLELKLAFENIRANGTVTPYLKAGLKHRFDFDSTISVFNPTTGLCAPGGVVNSTGCPFTANYDLKSDDTFWRIGGGLGAAFNGGDQTGIVELMYQGSGDGREIAGKAQYVIKLR